MVNYWLIRALAKQLRRPEMKAQRRVLAFCGVIWLLFLGWGIPWAVGQPTMAAQERAALILLGIALGLGTLSILAAVVVRIKTQARWSEEDSAGVDGPG